MTQPHQPPLVNDLATRLASLRVADMATGLAADPQVAAVWSEFPDAHLYTVLIEDAHRLESVRFAAALTLRSKSNEQFKRTEPSAIATVFAIALQRDLAGYAYPWGSLWESGDPLGLLGTVFVEIGHPAVRPLERLLDDTTPRSGYLGSEEATEMAMRRYRVKDFAAFYIAQIMKLDLPWQPDLAKRDESIARMRQQLAEIDRRD